MAVNLKANSDGTSGAIQINGVDAVTFGASGVISGAQEPLVSGTNIKTINSISLLGSGDLSVDSSIVRVARTSNTILDVSNKGNLIDITSGTFTQTFSACSTLGSGWFCYIRNSGTGDITLDPNSTETIDGLTSYIMYPGEVRLVQCDGTALRTVVLNAFFRTFTSSGTFTKPPGYLIFGVDVIGGGGGGSRGAISSNPGQGGGGGGRVKTMLASTNFAASETITVGAGGPGATTNSTAGIAGGTSSIGTVIAATGGVAQGATNRSGSGGAGVAEHNIINLDGFGWTGAWYAQDSAGGRSAEYGGGSGGSNGVTQNSGNSGGSSLYGAGGGGSGSVTTDSSRTGGAGGSSGRWLGGGGGIGVYAAAGENGPAGNLIICGGGGAGGGSSPSLGYAGGAGGIPGGGGGGGGVGGTVGNGGAGARGEVRIWGVI